MTKHFDGGGIIVTGTRRTIDRRLFPSRELGGGWSLSLQADKAGYQCSPRVALDRLEEYDAVEVAVYGPSQHTVDIRTFGLPDTITSKFSDPSEGTCIGGNLRWAEVALLETAISAAVDTPGAGIPKGVFGWSELDVYLPASDRLAEALIEYGPRVLAAPEEFSSLFLSLDDASAHDPYAQIVRLSLREYPKILDLRNEGDRHFFERSGLSDLSPEELRTRGIVNGVDGVYFPESQSLTLLSPAMLKGTAYGMDAPRDSQPSRSNP